MTGKSQSFFFIQNIPQARFIRVAGCCVKLAINFDSYGGQLTFGFQSSNTPEGFFFQTQASRPPPDSCPTLIARRVFPQPPGPVNVTRRFARSNPWISLISRTRPMNELNGVGKLLKRGLLFEVGMTINSKFLERV
jgi:hypothetical protein